MSYQKFDSKTYKQLTKEHYMVREEKDRKFKKFIKTLDKDTIKPEKMTLEEFSLIDYGAYLTKVLVKLADYEMVDQDMTMDGLMIHLSKEIKENDEKEKTLARIAQYYDLRDEISYVEIKYRAIKGFLFDQVIDVIHENLKYDIISLCE